MPTDTTRETRPLPGAAGRSAPFVLCLLLAGCGGGGPDTAATGEEGAGGGTRPSR